MSDKFEQLTPAELKEVVDFLKKKNIDLKINFEPQYFRMSDFHPNVPIDRKDWL